ncbi:MAG TPA: hypothetical protein VMM13_05045, partial [Euzebya sp.]|nr:hypothetical protein [Euzebya sp.]
MITPHWTRALSLAVVACLLLVACAADRNASSHAGTDANPDQVPAGDTAPADVDRDDADSDDGGSHEDDRTDDDEAAGDQRAVLAGAPLPGAETPGVDIVMGEWALVPSVTEAPPGTTTFRFRNMGTVPHALRIRTSGSGRDRLEWRSEIVRPDQAGLLVADLAPGTYEVDCPVEDGHGEHDQLGMEIRFTIADGAAELAPL